MPEFTPLTPPETRYEITADEFINAAKGEAFEEKEWIYKKSGKDIKADKLFADIIWEIDDKQEYIVAKELKILSNPVSGELLLKETGTESNRPAFIFYKCIIPGINLQKSITSAWFFIHTHIPGGIGIAANSQSGYISISDNSQSGYIWISDKSQSGDIDIGENSQSGMIIIKDKSQSGDFSIRENSQSGNISISENSQSGNIWIRENSQSGNIIIMDKSQSGSIIIKDKSQSGNIWIRQNGQSGGISIRENSQSGNIWISGKSQSGNIIIREKSQGGDISIRDKSQSGDISIRDKSQSDYISIRDKSQSGYLQVHNSCINQVTISDNFCNVYFYNAAIPLVRFNNCFLHEMVWEAGTKGELYIEGGGINHLKLNKTALLKDAVFTVINTEIYIVQLQELMVQGQLILRNIKPAGTPFAWNPSIKKHINDNAPGVNASELEKAIYKSKVELLQRLEKGYEKKISNLKSKFEKSPMPLFRIVDSSLSKTEITGSDLREFNFEYCDSKLLEMFISGTQLPKHKIEIHNPTNALLPAEKVYEQKTAIYNQLKKIFENQGDIVEATWYHSKAMDYQKELLKLNYRKGHQPKWYSINKWFTDEGFDLLNLRLNRWSNNHGESWRRALGFTICVSVIAYACYYISLNYYKEFSFNGTWDFIGNYFSFLNPVHRVDFMVDKTELTAGAKIFDFLGRIAIGYCIYQFIAAFRRHGRRSG